MVKKAIVVRPTKVTFLGVRIPGFEVLLAGDFAEGRQTLTFHRVDSGKWNKHDAAQLWSVQGEWSPIANNLHHFELKQPQANGNIPVPNQLTLPFVAFAFKKGAGANDYLCFPLASTVDDIPPAHESGPNGLNGFFEGDSWEFEIHTDGDNVKSPVFSAVWNPRVIPARFQTELESTYDWHAGNDVAFYHDACAAADGSGSYFADLLTSINAAQKFIFIVDWSFHGTVMLNDGQYTPANTLGKLLLNKAKSGVKIAILTWKHGIKPADPPSDDIAGILAKIQNDAPGPVSDQPEIAAAPEPILWRADYRTLTYSHHQKFVVMDDGNGRAELVVYYGGLDLTKGRYDWPAHLVMADNTTQHFWSSMTCGGDSYDEWYNAEWSDYGTTINLPAPNDADLNNKLAAIPPRQPWHDVHARLVGPVAWDFAREFVARWRTVESPNLSYGNTDSDSIDAVVTVFKSLFNRDQFVQQWERPANGRNWSAQLLHSIDRSHWSDPWVNNAWSPQRKESVWNCGGSFERSIQDSYLRAIARAERFIYMENQYFIGSGAHWAASRGSVANAIPEALVNRTKWMIQNRPGRDFHVYVLIPMMPEGEAVPAVLNAYPGVRALEWQTIGYMIKEVRAACPDGKKWSDYLSFCFLMHSDASGENNAPSSVTGLLTLDKTARTNLCRLNRRYMVYIHCKLMIVDDRYLILGSANANERSMAGNRDTEICVALWPSSNRVEQACETSICTLRQRLLDEHMGGAPQGFDAPESAAFRAQFQTLAQNNYRSLLAAQGGGQMTGHLAMLPFDVDNLGNARVPPDWFTDAEKNDVRRQYLIDSLRNHEQWKWRSDLNSLVGKRMGSAAIE